MANLKSRSPSPSKPRYEARFRNGSWGVFDRRTFSMLPNSGRPMTEHNAKTEAAELNKQIR